MAFATRPAMRPKFPQPRAELQIARLSSEPRSSPSPFRSAIRFARSDFTMFQAPASSLTASDSSASAARQCARRAFADRRALRHRLGSRCDEARGVTQQWRHRGQDCGERFRSRSVSAGGPELAQPRRGHRAPAGEQRLAPLRPQADRHHHRRIPPQPRPWPAISRLGA